MSSAKLSPVHSNLEMEQDQDAVESGVQDCKSPNRTKDNTERNGSEQNLTLANDSLEKERLRLWLNKILRIEMTDGRVLTGIFLCTDRDSNIILGSCGEYLNGSAEEARMLGLVMIPGRHIVSIHIDVNSNSQIM